MKTIFARTAIATIRFYQTFISPYKGFRCAHAHLHQQDSCSTAVIKIIRINGVIKAWPFIRKRFDECRLAFETIEQKRKDNLNKRKKDKKKDDRWDYCDVFECGGETACHAMRCGSTTKHCDNISICDCSIF
jgi:uncharacterized protein